MDKNVYYLLLACQISSCEQMIAGAVHLSHAMHCVEVNRNLIPLFFNLSALSICTYKLYSWFLRSCLTVVTVYMPDWLVALWVVLSH